MAGCTSQSVLYGLTRCELAKQVSRQTSDVGFRGAGGQGGNQPVGGSVDRHAGRAPDETGRPREEAAVEEVGTDRGEGLEITISRGI